MREMGFGVEEQLSRAEVQERRQKERRDVLRVTYDYDLIRRRRYVRIIAPVGSFVVFPENLPDISPDFAREKMGLSEEHWRKVIAYLSESGGRDEQAEVVKWFGRSYAHQETSSAA